VGIYDGREASRRTISDRVDADRRGGVGGTYMCQAIGVASLGSSIVSGVISIVIGGVLGVTDGVT
jgi:hypothetical protein